MQRKKRIVSEKSLANLKPNYAGANLNPNGRAGKDGKCRTKFTIKGMLTTFLDTLTEDQRNLFFMGLYKKAVDGDVQAIKLMAQLNDEFNTSTQIEVGDSAKVVVMVPKLDIDNEIDEDDNNIEEN